MTTPTPQSTVDLAALRATGGGDIPENQTPPQKKTEPVLHYSLCIVLLILGLIIFALAILGVMDVPYVNAVFPALFVIAPFIMVPGFAGIYRGPGEPSTHVIPRPKNRSPIDLTAGAGGAAGPAPTSQA